MSRTYSIFGLGKLGASMAAAIASRGFRVIGVDVSENVVNQINAGQAPVQETHLAEFIASNSQRLSATLNHYEAIHNSDITFIVVPTPNDERGAFSLQYAAWALREIGKALKDKDSYHNIVLTSTVLPGATRYGLLPILEKESGKVCGRDFGLCYSPEFIALGSVIKNFLNPDFTLVGEFDTRSGCMLEAAYTEIMEGNPPCQRMSLENAELAKISVNAFVTTKITFANMLADLCQRIPGGDVDVVTQAMGLDKRIGSKYLTGALGYGGPCFPRDNIALSFIAKALGARADLAEVTDRFNRELPKKILEYLQQKIRPGMTLAILGLAYKPLSHVTEESQSVYLAKMLSDAGVRVVAYDPLANAMAQADLKDHVVILDSIAECLKQSEVVLIATPDPDFQQLTAADFMQNGSIVTVVDFWRLLDQRLSGQPLIEYIPIGRGIESEHNQERLQALWGNMTY